MTKVIKNTFELLSSNTQPYVLKPKDLLEQLNCAEMEAQDVVTKAEQQARMIVQTARGEAQSVRDEAYAEGYKAGAEEVAKYASQLIERLEDDIASVTEERESLITSLEPEVLKLCMEIAEKVIRHEVKTNPRIVMRNIESCLRRIKDRNDVYVRVSPKEITEVRAQRDELLGVTEGTHDISIVDDRRVSPGGCIVESPSGDLDARIETQIEQVNKKLMETLDNDRRQSEHELDEISQSNQQDGYCTH